MGVHANVVGSFVLVILLAACAAENDTDNQPLGTSADPLVGQLICRDLDANCNAQTDCLPAGTPLPVLQLDRCAKTCNNCLLGSDGDACVDKLNPVTGVSDCPSRAYLCNDATYRTLMQGQCPKTCGVCPSRDGGAACVDKLNPQTGVSDCPRVAYLCNNSVYRTLMQQQCPATCGFCVP